MSVDDNLSTEQLLQLAERGVQAAVDTLLSQNRSRLKRMVNVRMDDQLRTRVDPSDVVQDALTTAARKLPAYLQNQQIPFYPWLRTIASERLMQLYRRHVGAQNRSVTREVGQVEAIPDKSAVMLAEQLIASGTSPSVRLAKKESQSQVRVALDKMSADDRELLMLKYLEQASTAEIGAVMGLTAKAVRSRHGRALERLRRLLEHNSVK